MTSRIYLAKKDIQQFFDAQEKRIYRSTDLSKIYNQNCASWRLKKTETASNFVKELTQLTQLKKIELNFPNRKETRYAWGDISIFKVLLDINTHCYFSHYTAMFLNGLTEQIPKTIFLNSEQTPKPSTELISIEQKNVDLAFRNKPRETNNITTFEDYKIYHLSGKFTNNLGVIELDIPEIGVVRTTNIERTLIDATVRPMYSGGVFEISNAFKNAKGKVSINKLLSYLQKLNYKYPYHQSIGFYMDRANYDKNQMSLIEELERSINFYIDYKMSEMDFNPMWKIYHPAGL